MKIKYTSKIRRGLAALAEIATLTEDSPPPDTVRAKWTKAKRLEYNAALDWIEQENAVNVQLDESQPVGGSTEVGVVVKTTLPPAA